jgi:hypothetical protein
MHRCGDGGFGCGLAFTGGHGQQLSAELLDLALDGGGVERDMVGFQAVPGRCLDVGMGRGAGIRGLGGVVLLGDFRAVADLEDQLLLGVEVVTDQRLQDPDLVE